MACIICSKVAQITLKIAAQLIFLNVTRYCTIVVKCIGSKGYVAGLQHTATDIARSDDEKAAARLTCIILVYNILFVFSQHRHSSTCWLEFLQVYIIFLYFVLSFRRYLPPSYLFCSEKRNVSLLSFLQFAVDVSDVNLRSVRVVLIG